MKCVLLAAGYAVRMYPLTLHQPKPLLPVAGRPVIDYIMDKIQEVPDVDDVIVVTNARFADQFQEWRTRSRWRKPVEILNDKSTSPENRLGAIGDLAYAIRTLGLDDDLLVVAGDNLFDFSLARFVQAFREKATSGMITVYRETDTDRLQNTGVAVVDAAWRVTHFEEKPKHPRSTYASPAFYIYARPTLPRIAEYLGTGGNPDAPGHLVAWLYSRASVHAFFLTEPRYDIGSIEGYEAAERIYSARAGHGHAATHSAQTAGSPAVPRKLNRISARITEVKSQGASQAMLHATGLSASDLHKPQVGIASMWFEGNPCNMHLNDLAARVKDGVRAAGMVGMRFNTIGVSDGISMGTEGMSYSLPSRDIIADSIETVMHAQWYDANVSIPGCDKNMPGCILAMVRVNRPSLMVYGGTIRPGCRQGRKLDLLAAFQSYGQLLAGEITEEERTDIIRHSCPGPGACGGMYTANTMASAIEVMGMSLPYSASIPAEYPAKQEECFRAGAAIRRLLELDLRPRDIITRDAILNAIAIVMALGGSTNAVLHLLAIARAVDVPLSLDDFQKVSDRVPLLADLKPSGRYAMEDLHVCGGTPAVLKLLLEHGLIRGDCITVTGQTLAENLRPLPGLAEGQEVVRPFTSPIRNRGHIQVLKGNLAPGGAVAKITGKEGERFSGPANVFDSEEDMLSALERQLIRKGDVVVIRYEGPKGGPGMPEMLTPTSAIMGAGMGKEVALITDGRFSGGSHGFIVGHITPEAQEGGPIALVKNGDRVTIDAVRNRIEVEVSDGELAARRASWRMPPYKVTRGVLRKYIRSVRSASEGCVTDE